MARGGGVRGDRLRNEGRRQLEKAAANLAQRESPVREWLELGRIVDDVGEVTEDVLDRLAKVSTGWTTADCEAAIAALDLQIFGSTLSTGQVNRLQAGIRLRLSALAALHHTPTLPDAVLVPFLGADLHCKPAALTDNLRERPQDIDLGDNPANS